MQRKKKQGPMNPRVVALVEVYGRGWKDPRKILAREIRRVRAVAQTDYDRPPFRPSMFAAHLAVDQIATSRKLKAPAVLERIGDKYKITIKYGLSKGRSNFSAFHEMTHIFFDRAAESALRYVNSEKANAIRGYYREEERLCDFGAQEWLLPQAAVQKYIDGVDPSFTSISQLAGLFEVSLSTMLIRFGELYQGSFRADEWTEHEGEYERRVLACSADLSLYRRLSKEPIASPPREIRDAFLTGDASHCPVTLFKEGSKHSYLLTTSRPSDYPRRVVCLYTPLAEPNSQPMLFA